MLRPIRIDDSHASQAIHKSRRLANFGNGA